MAFVSVLAAFFLVSYSLVIFFIKYWWENNSSYADNGSADRVSFLSVVIPFHNEEAFLYPLLKSLKNQLLSSEKYEVVFVDDKSTDGSSYLIRRLASQYRFYNYRIVEGEGRGKKAALYTGINLARGDLIVTTDADIVAGRRWLSSILSSYITKPHAFTASPVTMEHTNSFLEKFSALDFIAMQICGGGLIKGGHPVFCSGANLCFEKDLYFRVIGQTDGRCYQSGDDVFLLHAAATNNESITFLKNRDAMVKTFPKKSWLELFKQRVRWGGKSKGYKNIDAIVLTFIVFLTNLSFTLLFFLALFFNPTFLIWWVLFLSIKAVTDYILISSGKEFFDIEFSTLQFLLFSFIYPFFVTVSGIAAIILKERWK
ncbi:glycosyltransferase [Marinilabiliaceae bacterium ANBcel2]|nr:glycosyltransferase [Marinilabiliaceae bacterium ANBcel2]